MYTCARYHLGLVQNRGFPVAFVQVAPECLTSQFWTICNRAAFIFDILVTMMQSERKEGANPPAGGGVTIDTNLYSRQIGAFGMEAMGRLMQLRVLISGLNGVGAECGTDMFCSSLKFSQFICPAGRPDLCSVINLSLQ